MIAGAMKKAFIALRRTQVAAAGSRRISPEIFCSAEASAAGFIVR